MLDFHVCQENKLMLIYITPSKNAISSYVTQATYFEHITMYACCK